MREMSFEKKIKKKNYFDKNNKNLLKICVDFLKILF